MAAAFDSVIGFRRPAQWSQLPGSGRRRRTGPQFRNFRSHSLFLRAPALLIPSFHMFHDLQDLISSSIFPQEGEYSPSTLAIAGRPGLLRGDPHRSASASLLAKSQSERRVCLFVMFRHFRKSQWQLPCILALNGSPEHLRDGGRHQPCSRPSPPSISEGLSFPMAATGTQAQQDIPFASTSSVQSSCNRMLAKLTWLIHPSLP